MANSPEGSGNLSNMKEKFYRVMIGCLYSTREEAEEKVRSAADKGFEMSVHVVNEDFAFFVVQSSARSDRSQAEKDKQQLIDVNFDAYIANP